MKRLDFRNSTLRSTGPESQPIENLEAESCAQLVGCLRQLANLVSYSAAVCEELTTEGANLQSRNDPMHHACKSLHKRLEAIAVCREPESAQRIASQSALQLQATSCSKGDMEPCFQDAHKTDEKSSYQAFVQKWHPAKYQASFPDVVPTSEAPRMMSPSRSRRFSTPSAPFDLSEESMMVGDSRGGPSNADGERPYLPGASMNGYASLALNRSELQSLQQGRLTRDIESMKERNRPKEFPLQPVIKEEKEIIQRPTSRNSAGTRMESTKGLSHVIDSPRAELEHQRVMKGNPAQVEQHKQNHLPDHSILTRERGRASVSMNPLYLLIPQDSERSPRSGPIYPMSGLGHQMRTDSAGAISVSALSAGAESPASKKRSVELDAIIAEGHANWQRTAQASLHSPSMSQESGSPRSAMMPTLSRTPSLGVDSLNLPRLYSRNQPCADVASASSDEFTPLGHAVLRQGHLSFALMDIDHQDLEPPRTGVPAGRPEGQRQQEIGQHQCWTRVFQDPADMHNAAKKPTPVAATDISRAAMLPHDYGPDQISNPDSPRARRIPRHPAESQAQHSQSEEHSLPHTLGDTEAWASQSPAATPRIKVVGVGTSQDGSEKAKLPVSSWQKYAVQGPDDVFVPPLNSQALPKDEIAGNIEAGPKIMSGMRPRSPGVPAEIVMRRGPLQSSAHQTLSMAGPTADDSSESLPQWGQSRYVLPGDPSQSSPWRQRRSTLGIHPSAIPKPFPKINTWRRNPASLNKELTAKTNLNDLRTHIVRSHTSNRAGSLYPNAHSQDLAYLPPEYTPAKRPVQKLMTAPAHLEHLGRTSRTDAYDSYLARQSWEGNSTGSSFPDSQSISGGGAPRTMSRGSSPPTSPLQSSSPTGTFPKRFGMAPYTARVLATR